ncbi:multi-copper polyphenol oxidoreductase laccase [Octadecabacter antarcticus 307]|uniref:Purine nucleoside phosphorylase n=1 Tax=Octadecabacter antarcticus 307 TaxID=391626 RepID=M9R493_9RHOB|nr:peptidoglycan editing factor PgeF [Octadecabacter antarcticus]AGI66588.1 multi-copper polyphenol oxidoreductase laccase [Octadecabacter antarcticus 307]
MTLEIITSYSLAPLRHGFFTRRGGASSGVFRGLNCGTGSSDQHDVVTINRTRVADAMGLPLDALMGVHQIHSADVITLTQLTADRPKADALVTATRGIALSVLAADCQPVLFADHHAGVIGAAHAGWKGALGGVLEATLDAMEALGATRTNTHVVIGPSISQTAYEVGPEFFEDFIAQDPDFARFFANGKNGKYQFDLQALGLHRLRQAGVGSAQWTRHCTYADPDRFYSYRRATHHKEADYGRLIAAITLGPAD